MREREGRGKERASHGQVHTRAATLEGPGCFTVNMFEVLPGQRLNVAPSPKENKPSNLGNLQSFLKASWWKTLVRVLCGFFFSPLFLAVLNMSFDVYGTSYRVQILAEKVFQGWIGRVWTEADVC